MANDLLLGEVFLATDARKQSRGAKLLQARIYWHATGRVLDGAFGSPVNLTHCDIRPSASGQRWEYLANPGGWRSCLPMPGCLIRAYLSTSY